MANQRQNSGEQDLNQLLKIRREKLKTLQEEGKDPFRITTYDQTEHSTDIKNHFDEMEGKEVSIAGRMMSKRVMGKASFCDVLDRYDSIQVYVARDQVRWARSRSTQIRSRCSPRTWFRCRRSSMAFRTLTSGTVSGIWTSS